MSSQLSSQFFLFLRLTLPCFCILTSVLQCKNFGLTHHPCVCPRESVGRHRHRGSLLIPGWPTEFGPALGLVGSCPPEKSETAGSLWRTGRCLQPNCLQNQKHTFGIVNRFLLQVQDRRKLVSHCDANLDPPTILLIDSVVLTQYVAIFVNAVRPSQRLCCRLLA